MDGVLTEGGSDEELDPYSCISRAGCETDDNQPYLRLDLGGSFELTTLKVFIGGGESAAFSARMQILAGGCPESKSNPGLTLAFH